MMVVRNSDSWLQSGQACHTRHMTRAALMALLLLLLLL
jgi:hypothetical protein